MTYKVYWNTKSCWAATIWNQCDIHVSLYACIICGTSVQLVPIIHHGNWFAVWSLHIVCDMLSVWQFVWQLYIDQGKLFRSSQRFQFASIGAFATLENGELVRAIRIKFLATYRDTLDVKIFELRNIWWCKQRQLLTITGIENPNLFCVVAFTVARIIIRT